MLIYIRHSKEEANNDATHAHDPKLTRDGRSLAIRKGVKLLSKYGIPRIIYCSPFRRTRQTLEYMLSELSKAQKDSIQIIYDVDLARYFSNEEKSHPDIDPVTEQMSLPIQESYHEFSNRIRKATLKYDKHLDDKEVIWCITHTTVYKRLAKIYNIEIPAHIPFVHSFTLQKRFCVKCNKNHIASS